MAIEMTVKESGRSAVGAAVRATFGATFGQIGQMLGWIFASIQSGGGRGDKRRQLHLVESLALGNRRQLLLVDYGNQRYLVGAGADSVGTPLAIERETLSPAATKPAPGSMSRSNGGTTKGPHLVRRGGRQSAGKPGPGGGLWRY